MIKSKGGHLTKKSFAEAPVGSAGNVILTLPSFRRLIEYLLSIGRQSGSMVLYRTHNILLSNLIEVPAKDIKKMLHVAFITRTI
jgi:hypothetical protein